MTDLPDDVLAALAAEETMLAEPWAETLDACNRPAEPMGAAEFAGIVERAMNALLNSPARWHGTPQNPHIRHPQGRYCVECGADTVALAEAFAQAARREAAEHAWHISLRFLTPEERDRAEWERSVHERLNEALLHLAHGLDVGWGQLPCAKYPRCVPTPIGDGNA